MGLGEGFMETVAFELGRIYKASSGDSLPGLSGNDMNVTVVRDRTPGQKRTRVHVGVAGQA